MKNNIFDYATSELSQDAFICWCANWFNDDSNPNLKEMSIELAKKFAKANDINSINVYRQFSQDVYIDGKKLALKIDVLLIINGSVAVIIEDKVHTGEHSNQIGRYVEGLNYLMANAGEDDDFYGVKEIKTVYFKTGFLFDVDKCANSDIIFSAEDFLDILRKYAGSSEIIDSYIDYLTGLLEDYEEAGKFDDTTGSLWDWKITYNKIAQHKLMREIFPEEIWDGKDGVFFVLNGQNVGGRPWTLTDIAREHCNLTNDILFVHWRIDTDSEGPYFELRMYDDVDKSSQSDKDNHTTIYDGLLEIAKNTVEEEKYFTWNEVYPGYKGNYKGAALIHIELRDILKDWPNKKDGFIKEINRITNSFLLKLKGLSFID